MMQMTVGRIRQVNLAGPSQLGDRRWEKHIPVYGGEDTTQKPAQTSTDSSSCVNSAFTQQYRHSIPPAIAAKVSVLGLPSGTELPMIPAAAGQAKAWPIPARARTTLNPITF